MYIIMFEGVRPGKEESEHGLSHLKHREITFDKIKFRAKFYFYRKNQYLL